MGLFGFGKKKKDEYDFIYDNGDDSGIDYSEPNENEDPDQIVEQLKTDLGKGPCPKCGKISMIPDNTNTCYYCLDCGYAEHEYVYLRDIAGYPLEIDSDI